MRYTVVDSCEFMYPDVYEYASSQARMDLFCLRGGCVTGQALVWDAGDVCCCVQIDGLSCRLCALLDVPVEANPFLTEENSCAHCPERTAPFRVYDCIRPFDGAIHSQAALYLYVTVPEDAQPGVYRGGITVGSTTIPLSVTVSERAMPRETLESVTWFNGANVAKFHHLQPGTAAYDDMMCRYYKEMRRMHQTVLAVSGPESRKREIAGGKTVWEFDCSRMEREIREAAALGFFRFQLPPVGSRESWQASTILVNGMPSTSHEAYLWLYDYLQALKECFSRNSWLDCVYMSVSDEPNEHNATEYRALAGMIHHIFPELKLCEAVSWGDIHGSLDIYVPVNAEYERHREGFESYRARGARLWHYVCCQPRGDGYINRYMDMPLLAPRYLFWGNFKYGLSGYLHWAFNAYQPGQNPFESSCPVHHNADSVTILPAGDTHLVYPGDDGPWPSVRLEAQREGIEDYEMLLSLQKTDPDAAAQICDSCFSSFRQVNYDPLAYRAARNRLILGK